MESYIFSYIIYLSIFITFHNSLVNVIIFILMCYTYMTEYANILSCYDKIINATTIC